MPKITKVAKTSRVSVAPSKNIVRRPKEGRTAKSRTTALSVPVFSLIGKESGTLALPKEIFGTKVNKVLLSQAVRVYSTNQKFLTGSTKTRGEVHGTTAKMYRQKGTGRARHGAKTAPIFVGGGRAFGPSYRKVRLELPKKMKKAALISALSDKLQDNLVLGLTGLEKASGKTSQMANLFSKVSNNKSTLLVIGDKQDNVIKAARNLQNVEVMPVEGINAYEVVSHHILAITKEAVEKLSKKEEVS